MEAEPTDKKYITVYLPSWCEPQLKTTFKAFPDFQFQIFCRETNSGKKQAILLFYL